MDRPPAIAPRSRPAAAAPLFVLVVVALSAAFGSSCILDFEGLAGPGTGGGAGTAGGGGQPATGGTAGSGTAGGGACAALDCCPAGEPIELAHGAKVADLPRGLRVRDDGLYWVNLQGGNVVRLPSSGGAVETLAPADGPRDLAIAGDTLVWTAKDGIHACALPSCAANAHLVVASLAPDSLRAVAFDGVTAVFTDRGAAPDDGRTRSCALAACAPLDLATGMKGPEGVALDGGFAFWVEQGNGNMNGSVARSPAGEASLTQMAAGRMYPLGIAVDDAYAYWTEEEAGGHVYRCPVGGTYCDTPEDIAPAGGPLGHPTDIQIAGGRIYWANVDDGTILSCPQPGCEADEPKVHVTGRQGLMRLAINSTCLFWTENGAGGGVYKTSR